MPRTILLTGVSGFIAKRIAYDLLKQGDIVRGTLRSLDRVDEVRAAMGALSDEGLERLTFVQADLTSDVGWDAAMAGVDAVMHTASPFPLESPKDESIIIKPAVEGTERVLKAAQAAGVTRVIITSSMEAIMHGVKSSPLSDSDWSDPSAATAVAYTRSKIFAEKAAWAFAENHPEMELTAINPGLVCGIPMDNRVGSSVSVVQRILSGKDPMVPDFMIPVVDVEDISACHLGALNNPASIANRYICADSFLSMPDMAAHLADNFPDRKIARRIAPKWLVSILALFDKQLAVVKNMIGLKMSLTNAAATRDLGVTFVPAREAILRTARFLDRQGLA